MSDEYTPTTEQIRSGYAFVEAKGTASGVRSSAFDRWLAEHDREVAEAAWDEGVDDGQWNELHKYQTTREQVENPYRKG